MPSDSRTRHALQRWLQHYYLLPTAAPCLGRQAMLSAQAGDVGALLTVVDVVRICQLQKAISTVWTTPSADTSTVLGDTPEFAWPASLSLMWGFSYGLTVLETAANPFLVLCGHPDYAEARLLVAQGVQVGGNRRLGHGHARDVGSCEPIISLSPEVEVPHARKKRRLVLGADQRRGLRGRGLRSSGQGHRG